MMIKLFKKILTSFMVILCLSGCMTVRADDPEETGGEPLTEENDGPKTVDDQLKEADPIGSYLEEMGFTADMLKSSNDDSDIDTNDENNVENIDDSLYKGEIKL